MRQEPATTERAPVRWALKVGRLFRISLYIHVTFPLILLWLGALAYSAGGSAAATREVALVLCLFACVVLHELGHALTARRYGIETREITLYPIGGVARLERMPSKPREELVVALAGPMVNLVIAAVLMLVTGLSSLTGSGGPGGFMSMSFVMQLLLLNVALAVFNLLPAFPMDGGRVLRALLAMRLSHDRATEVAAQVGQGGALVLGLIGLAGSPMLVVIAIFIWFAARQEAVAVKAHGLLGGRPVHAAMLTDFEVLDAESTLGDAASALIRVTQHDFPVVDEDEVLVGVLTRRSLVDGLAGRGPDETVEAVMETRYLVAAPTEPLEDAVAKLEASACATAPVVHEGKLVGLLTRENIREFLMLREAQRRRAG